MAPNKKKRSNKRKKQAAGAHENRNSGNPKSQASLSVSSSEPKRSTLHQDYSDETSDRLYCEVTSMDDDVEHMLDNGANERDLLVLKTRKRIGEKLREIAVHKEELRWRHAQQIFDEFYRLPLCEADEEANYNKECPVCAEELSPRPVIHVCCGKVECPKCLKRIQSGELEKLHEWLMDNDEDYERLDLDGKTAKVKELMHTSRDEGKAFQCIFCRRPTPASDTEYREYLEQAAQLGRAWAQSKLSEFLYKEGKEEEGLEWLEKAVAQGYAPAQLSMGTHLADQDPTESVGLIRTAAHKGDAIAQCVYGLGLLDDFEEEAIIMLTLSALRGVELAEREMARKFGGMDDPNKLETAIYWYERAAAHGDALSQSQLSMLLIDRADKLFTSCCFPGYSPVPQAYRWNCRARQGGYQDATEVFTQVFEKGFMSSCGGCGKRQQQTKAKFLHCSKCKALTLLKDLPEATLARWAQIRLLQQCRAAIMVQHCAMCTSTCVCSRTTRPDL